MTETDELHRELVIDAFIDFDWVDWLVVAGMAFIFTPMLGFHPVFMPLVGYGSYVFARLMVLAAMHTIHDWRNS